LGFLLFEVFCVFFLTFFLRAQENSTLHLLYCVCSTLKDSHLLKGLDIALAEQLFEPHFIHSEYFSQKFLTDFQEKNEEAVNEFASNIQVITSSVCL
jgi:CTP:phosphocholine cytidylyltransferase-like protein